ncbi:hypothetical protein WJX81_001878 [Elliptochloris bilobata]|uniref:UBC core domain-containing protein n=1 Tax=Elliptochloris bilobata TaxID=381761 RepID=A0AAW1RG53_9CHLO
MPPKVCVNKLKREMKDFISAPPPHIPAIHVNEGNLLEWHFLIEGPPDTPYAGGFYIGKLRFPGEYPFKPPSILMLTPNARFETGTRLCLSMSDFHPETWSPLWSVATILTGLLSFMLESEITTGSLETSDAAKMAMARASVAWNLRQPQLATMFPQLRNLPSPGGQAAPPAPDVADGAAEASVQAEVAVQQVEVCDADWAAVRIAEARLTEGDPAAAAACMDRALKRHRNGRPPAVLLMAKAAALARAGDLDAAAALAQEAAALPAAALPPPAAPSSNPKAGEVDLAALDPAACQRAWRAAAQAKDEGNAAYRQGKPDAARAAYERALHAEPACATVACNLAAALGALGRHEEAAAAARRSLGVSTAYGKARRRLADSLLACGRYGEAAELYMELVKAVPGDAALQAALRSCQSHASAESKFA